MEGEGEKEEEGEEEKEEEGVKVVDVVRVTVSFTMTCPSGTLEISLEISIKRSINLFNQHINNFNL